MKRNYTRDELWERASLRAAMHIRGLWEEKGSSDTRLLEALFLPDAFTVVGRSRAYVVPGRREHVVPRVVVVGECHLMLERGETDAAIAAFIREHVKVVLVSKEECERMDRRDQLGLRQAMPAGWKFGDDVFARLAAAGIEWDPIVPLEGPAGTGQPPAEAATGVGVAVG
jgi:hypothetical protein